MVGQVVRQGVRVRDGRGAVVQLDQVELVVRLDQAVDQQLARVKVVLARVVVRTADEDPAAGGYHALHPLQPAHWQRSRRPAGRVRQAVHVGHAAVLARRVQVVQ